MFHVPAHKNVSAPAAQVEIAVIQMAMANPIWEVADRRTSERVAGPYRSVNRARNTRDRLDLEYGAVRFYVRSCA